MTRPLDRHLDSGELDALVSSQGPGVSGEVRLPEEAIREAQRHAESCPDCDRKVQMHRSLQNAISRLAAGSSARGQDCPGEGEWTSVAAGLLEGTEANARMKHAAQCGYCGPLLKAAAQTLADEATPGEEATLAQLSSSSRDWQARMAQTLKNEGSPKRPREMSPSFWTSLFAWPRPAFAAAALALVVAAVWIGLRTMQPPSAEQLLAQSYTERRTIEVRIPGAQYAPMRVERGATASSFDKPQALLKAEALISEELRKKPADPRWLQAKARAELLDGNYDDAIKTLQRALELAPDSPSLLTDLGSAYFERAESTDRAIDYREAFDAFSAALAQSHDDPIALFNRALASERMFLYENALADWKRYLEKYPAGEWSDEARRRMTGLQEKLKQHGASEAEPLLGPRAFAELLKRPDPAVISTLDSRAEDYLNLALTQWLPAAYRKTGSGPASTQEETDAKAGLAALGALLSDRHSDDWLRDFLNAPRSTAADNAIVALSKADQADENGDPSTAESYAHNAVLLFTAAGNSPGVIRSQLEETYALQRAIKANRCLEAAEFLRIALQGRRYPWIEGQDLLERMACWGMVGNFDKSARYAREAVEVTERSKYGAIHLRSLAFQASLATEKGDEDESWAKNSSGLRLYWAGQYPPLRAYQFYADLGDDAESSDHGYVAQALWREAAAAISLTHNRSGEAMARYRTGTASLMIGDSATAESELRRAGELFAKLPQDSATRTYAMDCDITLASLLADRADTDAAMHKLQSVQPVLGEVTDYHAVLAFHRVSGKVYLQEHDLRSAEREFRRAVEVGEFNAKSLTDESDRISWDREVGASYRGLLSTYVAEGRGPVETVALWEWYRSLPARDTGPSRRQIADASADTIEPTSLDSSPHALNAVLGRLGNETVLAFAVLDNETMIWLLDGRGARSASVKVPSSALASVANRFVEECADPRSDLAALRRDSRQLYSWLIKPVEDRIEPGRVLIIEPDGIVANIPMQALVNDRGEYLGALYPMVWSPGLWLQERLRPSATFSSLEHALVIGAPSAQPRFSRLLPPLPDAAAEARTVASEFPSATLLTGQQATLPAVENGLLTAEIFHFAGHALNLGRTNGLVLSSSTPKDDEADDSDSILDGARVKRGKFAKSRLVVLSACQTAIGRRSTLVDPTGLVWNLLAASVPHVVATRWNVDSSVSRAFMINFYRRLLSGEPVSQAAQTASQAILQDPNTAHPYYWAAFSAFGRT